MYHQKLCELFTADGRKGVVSSEAATTTSVVITKRIVSSEAAVTTNVECSRRIVSPEAPQTYVGMRELETIFARNSVSVTKNQKELRKCVSVSRILKELVQLTVEAAARSN